MVRIDIVRKWCGACVSVCVHDPFRIGNNSLFHPKEDEVSEEIQNKESLDRMGRPRKLWPRHLFKYVQKNMAAAGWSTDFMRLLHFSA